MKRETDLASELGVPREDIREIRQSGELGPSGWKKERNAIFITSSGEETLRLIIANRMGISEVGLGQTEGMPMAATEMSVLTIPRNPRLLICTHPDHGEVRVKCINNENFMRGMALRARPPAPDSRVWTLDGRSPRWLGRW